MSLTFLFVSKISVAVYLFQVIFLITNYMFALKKLKKNIFKIIFILMSANIKIFSKN